jgi:hypothetical protein
MIARCCIDQRKAMNGKNSDISGNHFATLRVNGDGK